MLQPKRCDNVGKQVKHLSSVPTTHPFPPSLLHSSRSHRADCPADPQSQPTSGRIVRALRKQLYAVACGPVYFARESPSLAARTWTYETTSCNNLKICHGVNSVLTYMQLNRNGSAMNGGRGTSEAAQARSPHQPQPTCQASAQPYTLQQQEQRLGKGPNTGGCRSGLNSRKEGATSILPNSFTSSMFTWHVSTSQRQICS